MPQASVIREVVAPHAGMLTGYDVRQVGMTVVELGGGRTSPNASIDPSVGLSQLVMAGQQIAIGQPLARIHARNEDEWNRARARLLSALVWDEEVQIPEVILSSIDEVS